MIGSDYGHVGPKVQRDEWHVLNHLLRFSATRATNDMMLGIVVRRIHSASIATPTLNFDSLGFDELYCLGGLADAVAQPLEAAPERGGGCFRYIVKDNIAIVDGKSMRFPLCNVSDLETEFGCKIFIGDVGKPPQIGQPAMWCQEVVLHGLTKFVSTYRRERNAWHFSAKMDAGTYTRL